MLSTINAWLFMEIIIAEVGVINPCALKISSETEPLLIVNLNLLPWEFSCRREIMFLRSEYSKWKLNSLSQRHAGQCILEIANLCIVMVPSSTSTPCQWAFSTTICNAQLLCQHISQYRNTMSPPPLLGTASDGKKPRKPRNIQRSFRTLASYHDRLEMMTYYFITYSDDN